MAAKPRVHEVARELGIDSKAALRVLKGLGVYVKSPSSTIEPPVARKLRASVRAERGEPQPEPQPTHPEAIAAQVRRDTVRRQETDWAAYGFSDQEKRRWRNSGIPENKAHIAAMCRDSERRGTSPSRLTTAMLDHHLSSGATGETVLEALLTGSNYLRVQERLAARLGVELTGVNSDLLRLTTSARHLPEGDATTLGSALSRIDWEPAASVRIADAVVEVLHTMIPALRTQIDIRTQIAAYRTDGTVSPLLAAYARAHGVFHAGATLTALCDGIAGGAEEWVAALDAVLLIERAVAGRRFYFLREDAASELAHHPASPSGGDALPPSPDGVALLLAPEGDETVRRFVFWTTASSGITRCIALRASAFNTLKLSKMLALANRVETWEPDTVHLREREAASFLDRFAVRRSRPLGQPRSKGSAPGGTVSGGQSSPTVLRDIIVAYYSRSSSGNGETPTGRRNAPDHRWMVRGHWRRQWYPSDNTHRVIWIDEHESGATDHPLLLAERVEVH